MITESIRFGRLSIRDGPQPKHGCETTKSVR